ncbi:hypothetical protein [Rubritalea profundi]|nr:hypothetical protein [Rubritalea profundi]
MHEIALVVLLEKIYRAAIIKQWGALL